MSAQEPTGQEANDSIIPKSAENDSGSRLVVTPGARTVSQGSSGQESLRAEQHDTISSTAPSDEAHTAPWAKKYILTLDGGGVRGYSTLLIIQKLMEICGSMEQAENPEATSSYHPLQFQPSQGTVQSDKRSYRYLPVHYFDYVAGTSTGGLIAIMLSRLRMTIDDCILEYANMGQRIFGNPRRFSMRGPFPWNREKYDHKKLKAAVKDVIRRHNWKLDQVGDTAYQSDPDRCRTIVVAVRENNAAFANYLFRTYEHLKSSIDNPLQLNPGPPSPLPIYKVARATTAAPTYFKPIVINNEKFLDGGYGTANNPAWHAYFEVKQVNQGNPNPIGYLVSIGTGRSDRVAPVAKEDTGLWRHYTGILKYTVATTSDSEDTHLKMLALTKDTGVPYERFNVDGGLGDVDLGEWRMNNRGENLTLGKIREQTAAYLRQGPVRRRLEHVARILVKNRQERSQDRSMWNKVATGYRYRCTVPKCSQGTLFNTEGDLRSHLLQQHHDLGLQSPGTARNQESRLDRLVRDGRIDHPD